METEGDYCIFWVATRVTASKNMFIEMFYPETLEDVSNMWSNDPEHVNGAFFVQMGGSTTNYYPPKV